MTDKLCERCQFKVATLKCSLCGRMKHDFSEILLCEECSSLIHVGFLSDHEVTQIKKTPPIFCPKLSVQDLKQKVNLAKSAMTDRLHFVENYLHNLQFMRHDISAIRQSIHSSFYSNLDSLFLNSIKSEISDQFQERLNVEFVEVLKSEIISSENASKKFYDESGVPFFKLIEQLCRYPENEELFRTYCEIAFNRAESVDIDVLPKQFAHELSICIPTLIFPDNFSQIMREYREAMANIKLDLKPVHLTEDFNNSEILDIVSNCYRLKDEQGDAIFKVDNVTSMRRNGVFTAFLQFDHCAELLSIMEWHMRYRQCLLQPLLIEEDSDDDAVDTITKEKNSISDTETHHDAQSHEDGQDSQHAESQANQVALHRGDKVFALRKMKDVNADRRAIAKEFWSRGIISKISFTTCLVYFVDHGIERDVIFANIRAAPNFGIYSHIPCLAPECTLFDSSFYQNNVNIKNIDEINLFWKDAIPNDASIEMTILDKDPIMVDKMPVIRVGFNLDSKRISDVFSKSVSDNTSGCDSEVVDVLKELLNKVEDNDSEIIFEDFTTEIRKRLVFTSKLNSKKSTFNDVRMTGNPTVHGVRIEETHGAQEEKEPPTSPESTEIPEIIEPTLRVSCEPTKLLIDPLKPLKSLPCDTLLNDTDMEEELKKKILNLIDENINDLMLPTLVQCYHHDKEIQATYSKAKRERKYPGLEQGVLQSDLFEGDSMDPQNLPDTLQGTLYLLKNSGRRYKFNHFIFLRSDWKERLKNPKLNSVIQNEYYNEKIRQFINLGNTGLIMHDHTIRRCLVTSKYREEIEVLDLDYFTMRKYNTNVQITFSSESSLFPTNVLLITLYQNKMPVTYQSIDQLSHILPKPTEEGRFLSFGQVTLSDFQSIKPTFYSAHFEVTQPTVGLMKSPPKFDNCIAKETILSHIGSKSLTASHESVKNNDSDSVGKVTPRSTPNKENLQNPCGNSQSLTTTPSKTHKLDHDMIVKFLSACNSPRKPTDSTANRTLPFFNQSKPPSGNTASVSESSLSINNDQSSIHHEDESTQPTVDDKQSNSITEEDERTHSITEENERTQTVTEENERTQTITEENERTQTVTEENERTQTITEENERTHSIRETSPPVVEQSTVEKHEIAAEKPLAEPLKLSIKNITSLPLSNEETKPDSNMAMRPTVAQESPIDWNAMDAESPTSYFSRHPLSWNTDSNQAMPVSPAVPLAMGDPFPQYGRWHHPQSSQPNADNAVNSSLHDSFIQAVYSYRTDNDQTLFQNPDYLQLFGQLVQYHPDILTNPGYCGSINDLVALAAAGIPAPFQERQTFVPNQAHNHAQISNYEPNLDRQNYHQPPNPVQIPNIVESNYQPNLDRQNYHQPVNPAQISNIVESNYQPNLDRQNYHQPVNPAQISNIVESNYQPNLDRQNYHQPANPPMVYNHTYTNSQFQDENNEWGWDDHEWTDSSSEHAPVAVNRQHMTTDRGGRPRPLMKADVDQWKPTGAAGDSVQSNSYRDNKNKRRGNTNHRRGQGRGG